MMKNKCEICNKEEEKLAHTTQGTFCANCLNIIIYELEKALDELEED